MKEIYFLTGPSVENIGAQERLDELQGVQEDHRRHKALGGVRMNIMLIDIRRIIESMEYSIKNINDYWDNQPYIPSQLDAAKESRRQSIKPIEETLKKLRHARDWLKKNKYDMRVHRIIDEE